MAQRETAWPRDYMWEVVRATASATVLVAIGIWFLLMASGNSDSGFAQLVIPVVTIVLGFVIGSAAVLTGPPDTPAWPFGLILGSFFGVVLWAVLVFVL